MAAVMDYLAQYAPEALEAAKQAYRCFEPYGEDVQTYAWSTVLVPQSCENEVIELLIALRRQTELYPGDPEAAFNAEQIAWVVVEAERYYRAMVRTDAGSWNVRDYHMADQLDRLIAYHGPTAKAIVWAHNTHIGDARATDMARAGMVNIGQIVRERHESDGVALTGFGSHEGAVIAADEWGAPMQRKVVPPARPSSWEDVLHNAGRYNQLLLMDDLQQNEAAHRMRGHRAIGVIYRPEREYGNYVPTELPRRYDAFIHLDQTEALHPLHIEPERTEPPDLYPWGI
jgi:erythromycin esterase-like protein